MSGNTACAVPGYPVSTDPPSKGLSIEDLLAPTRPRLHPYVDSRSLTASRSADRMVRPHPFPVMGRTGMQRTLRLARQSLP